MLKFRPSKNRRTSVAFNEQQLTALIEKGLSDNCLRGFLYKRSSTNSKWRMKWFLLFENLLFYFDVSPQEQVQYAAAQIVAAASSSGRSHSHSLLANHQSIHSSLSSSSAGRVATTALSALIRRGQDKTDSNSHASGSRTPLRRASKQAQAAIASAQEEQWREALEAAALEPADEFGAEPVGEMASHSTETGGADGQVRLHQRSWLGHQRRASAGGQLHATSATRHTQTGSQRASSGCSGNANVDSRATPLRVPRARLQSDPQTRQETSTLPDVCRPANYLGGHIGPSSQLGSCIGGNKLGASCASAAIAAAAAANSINNQNAIGVAMCSSSSRASSRTLNSSSISGVSGHFLTHNEQTIGRTTTTTAGKAPVSYSSLLNRKIGVIFLEGSYCERLVDAVVDFEAAQDLDDSSSSLVVAAANRLASLQQLNAAAATTTDNIYDNCYGPPAQAAMATDQFAAAASGRGNPNSSSSILNTTTNNSATVAASNTYDPNQTACQQQQSITTTVTTTMANLLAMSKSADDNLEVSIGSLLFLLSPDYHFLFSPFRFVAALRISTSEFLFVYRRAFVVVVVVGGVGVVVVAVVVIIIIASLSSRAAKSFGRSPSDVPSVLDPSAFTSRLLLLYHRTKQTKTTTTTIETKTSHRPTSDWRAGNSEPLVESSGSIRATNSLALDCHRQSMGQLVQPACRYDQLAETGSR